MVSVLIVGSIRLYREGLVLLLSRRPDMHVLGAASGHDDVLAQLASRPDIVLLDVATCDSEAILADVKRLAPASAIVALGLTDSERDALACIEAGIAGFVSREASVDELVRVMEMAARGELQCTPQLAGTLLAEERSGPTRPRIAPAHREADLHQWRLSDGVPERQVGGDCGCG